VISEILAGVSGDNNQEFIELYNRGAQPVDLRGWSLWYRLSSSPEEQFVHRWTSTALIPGQGHYLLGRLGQDLGLPVDAYFTQALNLTGGSLVLRRTDGAPLDRVGWGKSHPDLTEGEPAPPLENGLSLERAPGSGAGNGQDTEDNRSDFALNPQPSPQNTGAPLTPFAPQRIVLQASAPQAAEPGTEFEYALKVENLTGQALQGVIVNFPLPQDLEWLPSTPGLALEGQEVVWVVGELPAGGKADQRLRVRAPFAYFSALASNAYAQAENWPVPAFAGPLWTQVRGGKVPIAAARGLVGAELTIEGVVTMNTGNLFAGTNNTKFYLQDESGGIQVQVFGGQGQVSLRAGELARVRGKIGVYRGAVQLVPIVVPDDVQVIGQAAGPLPEALTIQQARQDFARLPGRLVQVQGQITRVEEFTYSYEIDLADSQGGLLTLYVDKLTGLDVDALEPGQTLQAGGILETRDSQNLLYPRFQADLVEEMPPALLVEASAPFNIQPGETFTTTLTVWNWRPESANDLLITAAYPDGSARLEAVLDGGQVDGNQISWRVDELPGGGASRQLRYRLQAAAQSGVISPSPYGVSAGSQAAVQGPAVYTFIGRGVPVWAIQGPDRRSPYVGERLSTQGIVTGVFPGLGGFWIQETALDADPATSHGVFVTAASPPATLAPGDLVEVRGKVREPSQQTTLVLENDIDLTVLSQGNPLPAPVPLDPPVTQAEAERYYEALEGMLVNVAGPAWAVSPTSSYGEYVVVLPYHNQARLYQGDDNGIMIMVDDGASLVHSDRSELAYVVASGDKVSGLLGPLAYTYGRYKIEPLAPPQVNAADTDIPALPMTAEDEISLMTWNAENLFDTRDPHPSDPPRPRLSEYQRDLTRAARTILAAGVPLVVGLQEIENLGVLEDLAAHELIAPFGYIPVLLEGDDGRGIDVGYLLRGDRVSLLDVRQAVPPNDLTTRHPLVVRLEIQTSAGPLDLYVINNHFTSMSAGVEATEPVRTAQAAWNVAIVQEIRAEAPDAYIAVLGDLNSFFASPPIETLRQAGLVHVFDALPAQARYTYIFQGESQTLDHILVTPGLFAWLRRVQVLHINADFPPPDLQDDSPLRKSDHDPVVATFSLNP
jgi:hypothetical protein